MAAGRWTPDRKIVRSFAGHAARDVLAEAEFGPGREVFTLSGGQFSSIDWIDALLDFTGPAHATISTWTAAAADLKRVIAWTGSARLLSARWLVDRSFPNRQPEVCKVFRETFGDACIRVYSNHAKFALLENDGWKILALTSANLNQNKRIEFFSACTDAALFDAFREMADIVFGEQAPGDGFASDAGKRVGNEALARRGREAFAKSKGMLPAGRLPLR